MMRCCSWQWGLIVHILPRFLLKRHFGIIRVQLQNTNTSSYNREIYISNNTMPVLNPTDTERYLHISSL